MASPPITPSGRRNFLADDNDDEDSFSQRSISLSSPPDSARSSAAYDAVDLDPKPTAASSISPKDHRPFMVESDSSRTLTSYDSYDQKAQSSMFKPSDDYGIESSSSRSIHQPEPTIITTAVTGGPGSPLSPSPSLPSSPPSPPPLPTYPPISNDTDSVRSFASTSSRKARPESMLITPPKGPLVLGVALVDFNHLVGPRIEYSKGEIFDDEEVTKILPFLALPDGAHLSVEDYSYFHIVPSGPKPLTLFGISCNRQIASSQLLVKDADVTRSTVQKAVVVIASQPLFGPIRDKLGVITQALFNQRDFSSVEILEDFGASLEVSLRTQLTASGLYMGTNLRELVHTFRQRTLLLVKSLMMQKKILFYGHPVERLCTYQYSLVSLFPGLLQHLDDAGSPPLNSREATLARATSLKSSDPKSMMAFMGQPLELFGKDALFQPYLPLQQLDLFKETKSWLCGSTNSIVTHRQEIDLLVNIETGTLDFRDPQLERLAGLTAADRKWMDDIVKDVNEGWDESDPSRPTTMHFKGSDDYLREKFHEYITFALSTVKYQDFLAKGDGSGVLITGGTGGEATSPEDFNPLFLAEFRKTNAFEVWNRITDPLMFDIVEPRHPCNEKPSVVSDIGLRLSEGIQELKLEQQLAPAREAVSRTLATGSTNFFKAVEGVRGWAAQKAAERAAASAAAAEAESKSTPTTTEEKRPDSSELPAPALSSRFSFLRRTSVASDASSNAVTSSSPPASQSPPPIAAAAKASLSSWGTGIGSFLSSRRPASGSSSNPTATTATSSPLPSTPGSPSSYVNLSPVEDSKASLKSPAEPVKDRLDGMPEGLSNKSQKELEKGVQDSSSAASKSSISSDSIRDYDNDSFKGEPAGMAM